MTLQEVCATFDGGRWDDLAATIDRLIAEDVVARIWNRDHTLWSPYPTEVLNRLGWLDLSETMPPRVPEIMDFVSRWDPSTIDRVLVIGMGGASLVSDVIERAFEGTCAQRPTLTVVDSTHPDAVAALTRDLVPERTLVILSMKLWALESYSLFLHFSAEMMRELGPEEGSRRLVVITDAAAWLRPYVSLVQISDVFDNDPFVGGRFSALSHVGLLPAALRGLDVGRMLSAAGAAEELCRLPRIAPDENIGAWLGAIIGAAAIDGRDKLTFLADPTLSSLLGWIEQLVAESTGKNGKGILPVIETTPSPAAEYSDDRLFVILRRSGTGENASGADLRSAGQPVIEMVIASDDELAAQFFIWEFAVATACHILGVQAFDQPDVEATKAVTGRLLGDVAAMRAGSVGPIVGADSLQLHGAVGTNAREAVDDFLRGVRGGDYVAVQAYLPPFDDATDGLLADLQNAVRERTGCAVTIGYGPRFLHSSGQLHKGDGGNGHFLQISGRPREDVAVPAGFGVQESRFSFDDLITAQYLGDAAALRERGRTVVRAHLDDLYDGLASLIILVRG